MTRQEQLNQWLGNRQRKYADGLLLFNALTKEPMKKKFAVYLASAPENPHIFDPHFTQLVNCLSKIDKEIKFSPSLYPAAVEEVIVAKTMNEEERMKTIETKQANIAELETIVCELTERIEELESDSENHADELVSLQEQIDEKREELATLRNEMDVLNSPGVKVITEESLTPGMRKAYQRIKEIAPLYASLHNDVANPDISDEERKALAEDLCKLDEERRSLWKQIDSWAEGKGELQLEQKRPVFSNNDVVRGFEIARRIKRLKQNITNSKAAADRAEKDGKKNVQQNALDRIANYETELAALEKEVTEQNATQG
jgi:hypothetical protein